MSSESVKAFFGQLEKDAGLADQYKALLKRMAVNSTDEIQVMDQVVEFAAQKGFEFSADDIKKVSEGITDGKISDTQLNSAAVGSTSTYVFNVSSGSIAFCWSTGQDVTG